MNDDESAAKAKEIGVVSGPNLASEPDQAGRIGVRVFRPEEEEAQTSDEFASPGAEAPVTDRLGSMDSDRGDSDDERPRVEAADKGQANSAGEVGGTAHPDGGAESADAGSAAWSGQISPGGSGEGAPPTQRCFPQSEAAVREAKTLFGDAGVEAVASDDPRIPLSLRQRRPPSMSRVIAVRCADGLSAWVVPGQLISTVQSRNPALQQSLVTDWNDRTMWWHRNTSSSLKQAFQPGGVELVCDGLIPVAFDGAGVRLQVLREGPIPEVETLELPKGQCASRTESLHDCVYNAGPKVVAEGEPRGAPTKGLDSTDDLGVDRPEVPEQFASQAEVIFGEARIVMATESDPQIPDILRQSAEAGPAGAQRDWILAVLCREGWCALIVTDPNDLDRIQSKVPVLATALITTWANAWVLWFFDEGQFEPSKFPADWLKGVMLVRNGLIPVARTDREAVQIRVVREGRIPRVSLAQVCLGNHAEDRPRSAASCEAGLDDREGGRTRATSEGSISALNSLAGLCRHVGADRVREITPDDPRLVPNLLSKAQLNAHLESRRAGGGRLLGIECGAKGKGHLATVIWQDRQCQAAFLGSNPELHGGLRLAFGAAIVNWLDMMGPVPRNLTVGALAWVSNGLIPILIQGDDLQDVAIEVGPIPVRPFAALRWDAVTKSSFQAAEIDELFGSALLPVPKNKLILNNLHLSELFLRRLGLAIDPSAQAFSRYWVQSDSWETVSLQEVAKLVTNGLVEIARELPERFPSSEITRKRVEQIVWLMEMRSAELPGQTKVIDQFLAEAMATCPGARATSEECLEACRVYCRVRNLTFGSDALFYRRLAKKYGPAPSHGAHRSRPGLRLKWDVISDASLSRDSNEPPTGQG